jgi:hypothetical protein
MHKRRFTSTAGSGINAMDVSSPDCHLISRVLNIPQLVKTGVPLKKYVFPDMIWQQIHLSTPVPW